MTTMLPTVDVFFQVFIMTYHIWASTLENLSSGFVNNKGASAQAGQHLCYCLLGKFHIWTCYMYLCKQTFIFLTSLCSRGDWFESHFVGNPEGRFCCIKTRLLIYKFFSSGFHYDFVTCGSTVKLFNSYHNVRLHSHDVKYGSGSGQQVWKMDTNNAICNDRAILKNIFVCCAPTHLISVWVGR